MPFGYSNQLLPLYSNFFDSRQSALVAIPLSYQQPSRHPLGLFSHSECLLLRPKVPYHLVRTTLRYMFVVDGFRLPLIHHCMQADLPYQVSLLKRAEHSMHLEALACFVHRVGRKHASDIIFQKPNRMLTLLVILRLYYIEPKRWCQDWLTHFPKDIVDYPTIHKES